ncbi:MAG: type II secretion system minor pseudopilin GspK, partial [Proteobacteria bacterium]|nr:type II secretion system minor pseudopilin GspK [Pseudomonadota bacterium]
MIGRVRNVRNSQSGIALVITLMITALMVVIITEIVYAVHLHQSMTGLFTSAQSAGLLAEGGVELTSAMIKESTDKKYTYINEDEPIIIPIEENFLTAKIVDEQARISVSAIIKEEEGKINNNNTKYFEFYQRLLRVLELDEGLADTAADWADIDTTPRLLGAEDHDYYMTRTYPYHSKGALFDSVGELSLVKGYNPEVMDKIRPFVTVYGDGVVNINNAPREILMALSEDMTGELADAVIEYRNATPFAI